MKSQIATSDTAEFEMRVLNPEDVSAASGGNMQIATQAYQAWMTCLKSIADSKGEVQKSLARFS